MAPSLLERAALLAPDARKEWLNALDARTLDAVVAQDWWVAARPEQMAPRGDWHIWLILSGRGWGKTRTGSEWIVDAALNSPKDTAGHPTEWAAFAQTKPDARSVLVEGPSGILNVLRRRGIEYRYVQAPMMITLPEGQKIHVNGADDPDVGRGLNLAGAWLDEIAKWRHIQRAWDEGISPALRTLTSDGAKPRAIITTTPKPLPLLKDWMGRTDGSVYVTRGSTFDNALNLSPQALAEMKHRYEGTRLGRQELYGELLLDVEGALWTWSMIEDFRVTATPDDVVRRIVAVDPAVTSAEHSAETGIITAAVTRSGHVYIENDVSLKASPDGWARRVVMEYERVQADAIVVETNQGGDMHKTIIQTVLPNANVRKVQASQGKKLRAEPVAALYEQGKVHHVGVFPELETQMTEWQPSDTVSPDRLDALVWACTELGFKKTPGAVQAFST